MTQSDGLVAAYLVPGGLRRERLWECQYLSGLHYLSQNYEGQNGNAVCLFKDGGKFKQMGMRMERIQENAKAELPKYETVQLASHIDQRLTTFTIRGGILCIHILDDALQTSIYYGWPELAPAAFNSFLQIMEEQTEARSCEIFWPEGGSMSDLPRIPPHLSHLTMHHMNPVFHHAPRTCPWMDELKANLKAVDRIGFINCKSGRKHDVRQFKRLTKIQGTEIEGVTVDGAIVDAFPSGL
ncbi:MAG: hypothetical protein L6R42_000340 [Xanthoria sp. 1 TBL-2021]|nr:MAG: hypothetical protein L6R42_000340 [Xanthoria sp. 1 TBL-2021]